MKKQHIAIAAAGVLGVAFVATFLHARNGADTGIPEIEINSRFDVADANKDGNISKSEFADYLNKLNRAKEPLLASVSDSKVGGCCGGGDKNAEAVPVKLPQDSATKTSSCCGGKDKEKTADAPKAKSGGCCGGGEKTANAQGSLPKVEAVKIPQELIVSILAATDALSADKLEEYQTALPKVVEAVKKTDGRLNEVLKPLAEKLTSGTDLKTARAPFEAFSHSFTAFVLAQKADERGVHVFQCTMTPVLKTANWIQKDNQELLNPFHGSAMLHCGKELK
ncbi:MAG: hypothetical protein LBT05_04015 [Planctomycetaceae bacterium]|jgi:hypothetical protein|nr:hypothetical protein [Planctomycetaceae bacterium]